MATVTNMVKIVPKKVYELHHEHSGREQGARRDLERQKEKSYIGRLDKEE